jgi:hypothetical protein
VTARKTGEQKKAITLLKVMEYDQNGKVRARYVHGLRTDEHLAIEKKDEVYYKKPKHYKTFVWGASGRPFKSARPDHNKKSVNRKIHGLLLFLDRVPLDRSGIIKQGV